MIMKFFKVTLNKLNILKNKDDYQIIKVISNKFNEIKNQDYY